MTDKNWKAKERQVARILGGKRVVLSGMNNTTVGVPGDVLHPILSVEVKSGRYVPKTVGDWLDLLLKVAEPGKVPALVMHPFRRQEYVVILTLDGLRRLLEVKDAPPAQPENR